MRDLARAIWFRREGCAWLLLFAAVVAVQVQHDGLIPIGPPAPSYDGGALVPSWPPETNRPTALLPPSTATTTTAGQPTTTLPEGPGRGTGPVPPPGLPPPTTTTQPPPATAPPTTLAPTTTRLCNRPGQPSPSTLPNGKPAAPREVDDRQVCTPTR